jgi:hypothetical protein
MRYLNEDLIRGIDTAAFRNQRPFPWMNPQGFLTDTGFQDLAGNMPDISLFQPFFGKQRKYGQPSHDRYVLEYADGLNIPACWQAFVDELRGDLYKDLVSKLLGRGHFKIRFHWHYTPRGCSVSPHCDSRGKLGSQIFYMNTPADWDPAWGGETVILDDGGRFDLESSPAFEEFDRAYPAQTMGNRSIVFGRRGNSWHGVRAITCPEGAFRRVFIVVYEDFHPRKVLVKRLRRLLRGMPSVTEKERAMY